jgi:hypothetical protein
MPRLTRLGPSLFFTAGTAAGRRATRRSAHFHFRLWPHRRLRPRFGPRDRLGPCHGLRPWFGPGHRLGPRLRSAGLFPAHLFELLLLHRGPFLPDERPRRFGPRLMEVVSATDDRSNGGWRDSAEGIPLPAWNSTIGAMIANRELAYRWGLSSHNPDQTDNKNPRTRLGSATALSPGARQP